MYYTINVFIFRTGNIAQNMGKGEMRNEQKILKMMKIIR